MPTIVLIGTLDTKGAEVDYVRQRLLEHRCDVLVIDAGVLGQSRYQVDIGPDEVGSGRRFRPRPSRGSA